MRLARLALDARRGDSDRIVEAALAPRRGGSTVAAPITRAAPVDTASTSNAVAIASDQASKASCGGASVPLASITIHATQLGPSGTLAR